MVPRGDHEIWCESETQTVKAKHGAPFMAPIHMKISASFQTMSLVTPRHLEASFIMSLIHALDSGEGPKV